MVRSATQFPREYSRGSTMIFFFFFFLQVRFLTSLFFFFFFCEISHPKISPWETLPRTPLENPEIFFCMCFVCRLEIRVLRFNYSFVQKT